MILFRTSRTISLVLVIIACTFAVIIFSGLTAHHDDTAEIERAFRTASTDSSAIHVIAAFKKLLSTEDPARAQKLFLSVMPLNPRSHTIFHESGYYLYDTKGLAGFTECKRYFNGGCFHGLVERAVADRGIDALHDILAVCSDGHSFSEARDCTHGTGHAVLLLAGYAHLPEAAAQCDALFKNDPGAAEDCDDGVFMENNFGAFAIPPLDRWYRANDPLYPCNDPRIASRTRAHDACWFLQSQATLNASMYPQFHGSVIEVASYCATVSAHDRPQCEIGLARQIQARYGTSTPAMISACTQAFPKDDSDCISSAAIAAYSFGDEVRGLYLCTTLPQTSGIQRDCFLGIAERITTVSYHEVPERLAACEKIPDSEARAQCIQKTHASVRAERALP